jgi:hypothetical protein
MTPFAVAVGFEKIPAAVGEDHGLLAIARDADRLDEALFSQVAEVAVTRSAGRSAWSRRSRAGTTRNAPTVASVRLSDPRSVYSRLRAS